MEPAPPAQPTAPLLEIFPSLQGEGLLAGTPQVFVRFGRCNLVCTYCDTPESIGEPPPEMQHVRGLSAAGEPRVTRHANPLGVEAVEAMIAETVAAVPAVTSVAVTGGEPLLHAEFLRALLPRLTARGLWVLLETNGILAASMGQLAPWVRVASVDFKLPAETGVSMTTLARKHAAFLRAARACPITYVKIVVTAQTPDADLAAARETIAGVDRAIPTFLTPVTSVGDGPSAPGFPRLLELAGLLRRELADVRVLPQVHAQAGWR